MYYTHRVVFDGNLLMAPNRLPYFAPLDNRIIRANHFTPDALDGSYGWPIAHLASIPYPSRWHPTWRCVALLCDAPIAAGKILGKYRAIPQIDAMALLLNHGTNVEAIEHTLRRQRAIDRVTRVSERRFTH